MRGWEKWNLSGGKGTVLNVGWSRGMLNFRGGGNTC